MIASGGCSEYLKLATGGQRPAAGETQPSKTVATAIVRARAATAKNGGAELRSPASRVEALKKPPGGHLKVPTTTLKPSTKRTNYFSASMLTSLKKTTSLSL